jgi:hypothetical protein
VDTFSLLPVQPAPMALLRGDDEPSAAAAVACMHARTTSTRCNALGMLHGTSTEEHCRR